MSLSNGVERCLFFESAHRNFTFCVSEYKKEKKVKRVVRPLSTCGSVQDSLENQLHLILSLFN